MNSVIHGFEQKKKGEIIIDIKSDSQQLDITYHDNGRGIEAEHLKKIFDPFFTTKRNTGGSGLGMHIVYNIVTQTLGGTIDCQSTQDKGVDFHITLPLLAMKK